MPPASFSTWDRAKWFGRREAEFPSFAHILGCADKQVNEDELLCGSAQAGAVFKAAKHRNHNGIPCPADAKFAMRGVNLL
jgi:hypothetical protein